MLPTIPRALEAAADAWGSRPAMKFKRDGTWHTVTWERYCRDVRLAARGMMALGLEPRRGVAIIGFNRPEWFVANLAAVAAGGVPAGIYTTSTPSQCAYIASHAEASLAVVENVEQLEKFRAERENFRELRAIVLMEGSDPADDVLTFDELLAAGDGVSDTELQQRIDAQQPEDLATLIYTSGTTGPPKAVMLSHANIVWTARLTVEVVGFGPDDRCLSYLPLSHIAEQIATHHVPIACGSCTWFAESPEKVGDNLREVRPTLFLGVPRVWEKMQAKMTEIGARANPIKRRIVAWARGVGLQGGYADQKKQRRPSLYGLAERLVFGPVRERIGLDQARFCASSAAPISVDTLEFFLSLGIPIYEIYGMSECCGPTTASLPNRYITGSVGVAAPGTEVRTAEDGEILMKGPHVFLGYYRDPRATADVLDADGWLHSGDIGRIDEHGFIWITDRKKDILITAGGKNIAPQNIEGQLKAIPAVAQAVVIGDRRPYLTALLSLDPDQVPRIAKAIGSPATDPASASRCKLFKAYLVEKLGEMDRRFARAETIKRFTIVPREFTVDSGELTPTMKIKRRIIHDKYASIIEEMYR